MKVDLYFCNDCRKFFPVRDRHVTDGHVQEWVDCELCGSEEGAFWIREINTESRNWILIGGDSYWAFDESFMHWLQEQKMSAEDDSGEDFEDWIQKHEKEDELFQLDMDAVREVCH